MALERERTARELTARKRKPPVMVELPPPALDEAPAPPPEPPDELRSQGEEVTEPPDPRIAYHVRAGQRVTEIASDEDWFILQQHLGQPELDALELWATERADAEMSVMIYPSENEHARALLVANLRRGWVDDPPPVEDDLRVPGQFPDARDEVDLERRYREVMGMVPTHERPEGPVAPASALDEDSFRAWAGRAGAPVTETLFGPVIEATPPPVEDEPPAPVEPAGYPLFEDVA